MIDYDGWERYRVVLVTGPQRSGTTFVSHVIAEDTGRRHIDEDEFNVRDEKRWRKLVAESAGSVIHCPSMMHLVTVVPDDVLVVLVRRPLPDIAASEARIGWDAGHELAKYAGRSVAAAVKYAWWADQEVAHSVIVDYDSLADHHLWVDDRAKFGPRQWQ